MLSLVLDLMQVANQYFYSISSKENIQSSTTYAMKTRVPNGDITAKALNKGRYMQQAVSHKRSGKKIVTIGSMYTYISILNSLIMRMDAKY